jgi:putative secretion ATPase (PEP-CTERM system associated)
VYSDFYGFTEQPFRLTPDARFYFDSRTHKKAMAYLGYGLAQGEGFIVITGDVGAGKSTLVQHLLTTIEKSRLNAISLVSTQVEGDDMLRLVAQGVGIPTAGKTKAQLLEAVENWLDEQARARKRTLLIVDEAQNLSVSALEELRMLSNFQVAGQALLQILLLGQPEFRDKLGHLPSLEQLRQRVIASHHLDPIEEEEMGPYIEHRLKLVGWTGRPQFDPDAFVALHRHSGGIPRRVNQLANRLMLFAAVEQLELIGTDAVDTVIADLDADAALPHVEGVFTLPGAARGREDVQSAGLANLSHERRIAALESQLAEQDVALRRVLTFLVDWVESGQAQLTNRRPNAA